MQNFSQIRNALMNSIDNQAVETEPIRPLKNTLKTLTKTTPTSFLSNGQLYNKKFTFDVSRSYTGLSQFYIKATLSTGSVAATVAPYFGAKILKSIRLLTKKGTELQIIDPQYISMRLDELYNTGLYKVLAASVEPDQAFTNATVTCFIPVFFFISEDITTALPTRELEQLELECITNDSKESMGMSVNLTTASFELFTLYHDVNTSNAIADKILTKKSNLPKTFYGSYNIFHEDDVVCASGSSSARLLLRCPYPLFSLHAALVSATSGRLQVKTMILTVGGTELVNLDYRINYQLFGHDPSIIENGTLSYFFNRTKSRIADSGLIVFSESMFPCYLDITYAQLGEDYTLKVFEEYRTYYTVNETGEISINKSDIPGTLEQANSIMNESH